MKRTRFERNERPPAFDPGDPLTPEDLGVDLVPAPTSDQGALDRVAELLDHLFAETVGSRR